MASSGNGDSGERFAVAFGGALKVFLGRTGMSQVDLAKKLGLMDKSGDPNKQRINTYLTDSPPMPEAQVLYLACTKLPGFTFEFEGYQLKAVRRKGTVSEKASAQMTFRFNRQFDLIDKAGQVKVRVKRPSGKIELLVSLDAKAS